MDLSTFHIPAPFEFYRISVTKTDISVDMNFPEGLSVTSNGRGINIEVPPDMSVFKPILILYGESAHNNIVLNQNSRLSLVELCDSSLKVDIINNISLHEDAKLNHYNLQKSACSNISEVLVSKASKYDSFVYQQGKEDVSYKTKIFLNSEQSTAKLNCACSISGGCKSEIISDIRHLSPHSFSEQYFKGIIEDNAYNDFKGKIHIAKDAVKSEGYLQHRSMLLSEGARSDCLPELEIFADDVKCSHGSASGSLDEMQLFYLRSRGIKEEDARRMLIRAYIEEIMSSIEDINIRDLFNCEV